MKSSYSKPTISFQNMALSTGGGSICQYMANLQFLSCAITIPEFGETIFNQSQNRDCGVDISDFPCYNIPSASANIFDS